MQKKLSVIIVSIIFAGMLFAQGSDFTHVSYSEQPVFQAQTSPAVTPVAQSETRPVVRKRKIDFMADQVRPFYRGKDSIVYFTGNFAAHHNGAVISCDSAVRFNDSRWGFYSKVIINQDSIYIYGDSAIYDGNISLAEVYAPIVKVVDGDALLYTYNFTFNTATKIGRYTDGGVAGAMKKFDGYTSIYLAQPSPFTAEFLAKIAEYAGVRIFNRTPGDMFIHRRDDLMVLHGVEGNSNHIMPLPGKKLYDMSTGEAMPVNPDQSVTVKLVPGETRFLEQRSI